MKRAATFFLALLAPSTAACTILLEPARHAAASGSDARTDAGSGPSTDAPAPSDDAAAVPDAGPPTPADAGADAGPRCDEDGDGHRSMACGGDDCDDTSAEVFPFAPPICGNGRAESCALDRQSALLAWLEVAEIGVLPRRDVASGSAVAGEVVGGVTAGPTAPHGSAWVAYRRRGAEAYSVGAASLDLRSGALLDWTPFYPEGLFARALGGGDLGRRDGSAVHAVLVATSPDAEEQRAVWLTAFADGSGASPIAFAPEARRGAAIVGTHGVASAIVLAADDRLVFSSLRTPLVFEAPLSATFSSPRVRGDGAGPYAHFTAVGGGLDVVWDLSAKACSTDADCPAPATCAAHGECLAFREPMGISLEERVPGDWIDLAYVDGALWYAHGSNREPGVVHVGTLDCGGASCVPAEHASTLVLTEGIERPVIEPLGPDAFAVAAVAAARGGAAIRVAFHQPSSARQVAPIDGADTWDLAAVSSVVEDLHASVSRYEDPRIGAITTLLVTVASPTDESPIWTTGLRACERL